LIKSKGFEGEIQEEGMKNCAGLGESCRTQRRWEYFRSSHIKAFWLYCPGSHHGKLINREDAELAIMFTHGLTNYIARKM